jgi:serine/threonine protein phosphatase PrpC
MSRLHYGSLLDILEIDSHRSIDTCTKQGPRDTQEDRIVVCSDARCALSPDVPLKVAIFGLFDGTVGSAVSDFMQTHLVPKLLADQSLNACLLKKEMLNNNDTVTPEESTIIDVALRRTFHKLDDAFLEKYGHDREYDYCTSTGVVGFLWKNLFTVAHVGDSRALICSISNQGTIKPSWLTNDHKPHQMKEKQRIVQCGGSLIWLHGNKPYIRGGDFFERAKLGHKPKQLNYSRAFGCKGLKKFGLTCEPDVSHVTLLADHK